MHINDLERVLSDLGACEPAMTWLRSSGCQTFEEAWNACPSGNWLRWLALSLVQEDGDDLELAAANAFEAACRLVGSHFSEERRKASADAARTHIPMADVERALRARLEAISCR